MLLLAPAPSHAEVPGCGGLEQKFGICELNRTAQRCEGRSEVDVLSESSRETSAAVLRAVGRVAPSVSFGALLMNPETNAGIRDMLRSPCADFLTELYRSGKTLKSDALFKASKSLSEIPFRSGVKDGSFFHWTRRADLIANLKGDPKNLDQIPLFLRTRQQDPRAGYIGFGGRVFYMAEDPDSSRGFGSYLLQIDFDLNARAVEAYGPHWIEALKELELRFPGLQGACPFPKDPQDAEASKAAFYALIAEDSGIDMIDYRGSLGLHSWFQVLSFQKALRVPK
jgi:hypothetical protein